MSSSLASLLPDFLASVVNADEAVAARDAGATIIDAKNPSSGALGALPSLTLRSIVAAIGQKTPVSATIGDLPLSHPEAVIAACAATAETGVDIVKCGFFGAEDARPIIAKLSQLTLGRARLVAVFMADARPDLSLLPTLAEAGFLGVMLDTADKSLGSLVDIMTGAELQAFVTMAQNQGLLAGLAGSLRLRDVEDVVSVRPDVVGFRGALCDDGRTSALNTVKVRAIAAALQDAAARPRQERSVA